MTTLSFSCDDLDLVVGLDDALGDRFVAQLLDGDQHVLLLVGEGVAERLRPVEVVAHHLDDLGIVEQRDHAAVPALPWASGSCPWRTVEKRAASTICSG